MRDCQYCKTRNLERDEPHIYGCPGLTIERLRDQRTVLCEQLTDKCDELKAASVEIEQMRTALENIAALDYTKAATTGACALAVRIAKEALPTKGSGPVTHLQWKRDMINKAKALGWEYTSIELTDAGESFGYESPDKTRFLTAEELAQEMALPDKGSESWEGALQPGATPCPDCGAAAFNTKLTIHEVGCPHSLTEKNTGVCARHQWRGDGDCPACAGEDTARAVVTEKDNSD